MKYVKKFENKPVYNYKYERGYIIYERPSWRNEHYPLLIMQIYDVPGPVGTKYDYYGVHELYKLEDENLISIIEYNPKKLIKNN